MPARTEIARPSLDDREYRYVELDNGLKALVITDADTDMAAAAMDVHIGQFADPSDREGLAHFLEHMLFMGTEAYPDVDSYREFVQSHGGSTNAYTSQEHTQFYFEIEHAHLEGALHRFGPFFVAPLLDPEYVQRERDAVHSEYRLKVQDESRRLGEVRRATSNPDHGIAKFSVGDLQTLADREGDAVWDALRAFYDAEYSASRMAVTVIGREDLDTLERWVRDQFSAVPTTGEGPPTQQVPPFLDAQLGVRIHVEPRSEIHEISMDFLLPMSRPHFREHPVDLLQVLVGQGGEGSVYSVLDERGWIVALDVAQDGAEDHSVFRIAFALTEEGTDHVDDIVDIVFQYLRRIAQTEDLSPWWDQLRHLTTLDYRFAERPSPGHTVQWTASTLQAFPPEHVLDAWATFGSYNPNLQRTYIDQLVPDRLRLFVMDPDLPTDQVEARYDVPWSMAPLDPETRERWRTSPIHPDLHLPPMNPFVPEDLKLHPVDGDVGVPTRLADEEGLEVWHLLDPSFGVPRSTTRVTLVLPNATAGMAARINARLFSDLVDDALVRERSELSAAGMSTFFAPDPLGMRLRLRGYDDKQHVVLQTFLDAAKDHRVDPQRFEIIRDDLVRRWRNLRTERSVDQVGWAVREALDPDQYSQREGAAYLSGLTPEALQDWIDGLFERMSVRVFVHGNHTADEAIAMAHTVRGSLGASEPAPIPPARVRRIRAGDTVFRDVSVDHDDSAIQVILRSNEDTFAARAQWLLLADLMQTPAFTQLRTEQQLGYAVWTRYDQRDHMPGLGMGIQSDVADPNVLLERYEAFLEGFADTLAEMPDATFEATKAGVIANLLEAPDDLYDRTRELFWDYDKGFSTFDRKARLAEHVRPLDRSTLLALLQDEILGGGVGRLVSRAVGKTHAGTVLEPTGCASTACVAERLPEVNVRER